MYGLYGHPKTGCDMGQMQARLNQLNNTGQVFFFFVAWEPQCLTAILGARKQIKNMVTCLPKKGCT